MWLKALSFLGGKLFGSAFVVAKAKHEAAEKRASMATELENIQLKKEIEMRKKARERDEKRKKSGTLDDALDRFDHDS